MLKLVSGWSRPGAHNELVENAGRIESLCCKTEDPVRFSTSTAHPLPAVIILCRLPWVLQSGYLHVGDDLVPSSLFQNVLPAHMLDADVVRILMESFRNLFLHIRGEMSK